MNIVSISRAWIVLWISLAALYCHDISADQREQPLLHGYPTLNGRLALTGYRLGKDENFIRVVDVNQPVSKDVYYIQCADPVYFNNPVLIGKDKSLWQFNAKMNQLEAYIHHNGRVIEEHLFLRASEKIVRTEIVADENINYLVVFVRENDQLSSVKILFAEGKKLRVVNCSPISESELKMQGSWSANINGINVCSHIGGPVITWCDYNGPHSYHNLDVYVSQLRHSAWTKPIILGSVVADFYPNVTAYDDEILVAWGSSLESFHAALINSEKGIKKEWQVVNMREALGVSIFYRNITPIKEEETIAVLFEFATADRPEPQLVAHSLKDDTWGLLGMIAHLKTNDSFYPFVSENRLNVVLEQRAQTKILYHNNNGWSESAKNEGYNYYLHTLKRLVKVGDFDLNSVL